MAIAAMVPQNSIVADIGSDHGLLIKYLLSNDIVSKAYASDNKTGPYKRLKEAFQTDPRVTVYFADGLASLASDVDTIVIAGMGGALIADILERGIGKATGAKRIVVSPHNQVDEVRKRFSRLGLRIVDETIAEEDGMFYDIIVWKHGTSSYTEEECLWGPLNLARHSDILVRRMTARIAEIDRILAKHIPLARKEELIDEKEWLTSYGHHA